VTAERDAQRSYARNGQSVRIASAEERQRARARFGDAVRDLADDPSVVNVFRYLRCSLELDATHEVGSEQPSMRRHARVLSTA